MAYCLWLKAQVHIQSEQHVASYSSGLSCSSISDSQLHVYIVLIPPLCLILFIHNFIHLLTRIKGNGKHLYYNHTAQWSEQRYTSLATWRLTCPVLLFSTSLTSLMFVSSFCICQLADYVFHGFTLGFWKAAHLSWTKGLELLEQNGQQWRHWYGSGEWLLMHMVQLLDAGSIIKELLPVLTEKKGKTWIKRLNTKH